jgi:hypothetical protein
MTCRDFIQKIEDLPLTELSSTDTELLAHQSGCTSCAALLRERNALAGAMRLLRTRTAAAEAPSVVEHNVLRAFRQSSAAQSSPALLDSPNSFGAQLRSFFDWRAYAAVAAVLAIALGLGLWFAQHSDRSLQPSTARTEQPAQPSTRPAEKNTQVSLQASEADKNQLNAGLNNTVSPRPSVTTSSLAQAEQSQGYTPLMLCDPLSCSDDAQVVRMELPASDGSTGTEMADVIVGDDGLVRAIRIVQQQ